MARLASKQKTSLPTISPPFLSEAVESWDIHSAANHVCVALGRLAEREELTEAERVAIKIAYRITSDASGDILRRTYRGSATGAREQGDPPQAAPRAEADEAGSASQ